MWLEMRRRDDAQLQQPGERQVAETFFSTPRLPTQGFCPHHFSAANLLVRIRRPWQNIKTESCYLASA
jgi:hypothetical protein